MPETAAASPAVHGPAVTFNVTEPAGDMAEGSGREYRFCRFEFFFGKIIPCSTDQLTTFFGKLPHQIVAKSLLFGKLYKKLSCGFD